MLTSERTKPSRVRFSRTDYHRMGETGILPRRPRVELLDGEIIQMSPIGPQHGCVVDRLNDFFTAHVRGRAICRVQGAIALDAFSEPEPDLALLKPRPDFYAREHPSAADVLLVIEVSDSSIEQDLGTKLHLYARSGIPEYWTFHLTRDLLIIHRAPAGDGYSDVKECPRAAEVNPLAFPDVPLHVGDVLPF